MATFLFPQVGKSAQPAVIRRWQKKAGEAVKIGEVLVDAEVEEGLVQIESGLAGTLNEILASEGKTVTANSPLGVVSDNQPPAKPAPAVGAAITGGAVIPIVMPTAGQSVEESTLIKWCIAVGDRVKIGDVLFEIETDKATLPVEATDSGRVARLVVKEGASVKCLDPVAFLAESDADVDAYLAANPTGSAPAAKSSATTPPAVAATPSAPIAPASLTETGRVKASPAARKIAGERHVDLSTLPAGSGPGGRIISTDVPAKTPPTASAPSPAAATGEGITRKKMSSMRKAIARNLLASKQTVPHFYIRLTINAEPLYGFYQAQKAKFPCSLNDVVVFALSRIVQEFPAFRSRIEGEEIVTLPGSNIGIAVGMDDGLVVPVAVNSQKLTLQDLGATIKKIAADARAGKIAGMGQGVMTITNLGMFGTEEFAAIINPPESAILAVGATREDVIVTSGALRPGKVMTMTLSVDHRVVDGMLAAKFLARLKELLEAPQNIA